MDLNKISNFIKAKRKELGITQSELAEKLFVTEKAISRWETGRGTPDVSLLLPLSKELHVDISELLNGEDKNKNKNKNDLKKLIEYHEITKANKYNFQFKLTIFFYILSLLVFLLYLRFEYNSNLEVNYFIRLLIVTIASIFVIIGNKIYSNYYAEKIDEKKKTVRFSYIIVFIYYMILLFNMVIFARYNSINSYNLVPFKSIIDIFKNGTLYEVIINILGNLLVFMPLEYFLIELFRVKKFSINFLISFGIILLIELLQYIFRIGVFDIDDLLLCTFGMMLFYIIYINKKKLLNIYKELKQLTIF